MNHSPHTAPHTPALTPARRAFSLPELVAVTLLAAAAAGALLLSSGRAQRAAMATGSTANLRTIGTMLHAYTADNAGGLPSYTWRRNITYTTPTGTYTGADDLAAAANQATDILRRRFDPAFVRPINWIPHISFSHLTLADHAGLPIPDARFVAPADRLLTTLSRDPASIIQFPTLTGQPRNIVRSSYATTASVFSGQERADGASLRHSGSQSTYSIGQGNAADPFIIARNLSAVAFPAHKAFQFEQFDYLTRSSPLHHSLADARCAVLFFDGSAPYKALSEANQGVYNTSTGAAQPAQYTYQPDGTLSPSAPSGAPTNGNARLEFTHRQLGGRDFGPRAP
jgi:type II secretory pathway pseudopilin PulG